MATPIPISNVFESVSEVEIVGDVEVIRESEGDEETAVLTATSEVVQPGDLMGRIDGLLEKTCGRSDVNDCLRLVILLLKSCIESQNSRLVQMEEEMKEMRAEKRRMTARQGANGRKPFKQKKKLKPAASRQVQNSSAEKEVVVPEGPRPEEARPAKKTWAQRSAMPEEIEVRVEKAVEKRVETEPQKGEWSTQKKKKRSAGPPPVPLPKKYKPPKGHQVILYPGEKITVEQVRSKLVGSINPSEIPGGVKGLIPVPNGLMVSCETIEGAKALRSKIENVPELVEMTRVHSPRVRRPRITIFGVHEHVTEAQLITDLRTGKYIGPKEEVKVMYGTTLKAGRRNWIIECGAEGYRRMLGAGKVRLGWYLYRVERLIPVVRCFRCCGFGHIQFQCSEEEDICRFCSKRHALKDCDAEEPRCINCIRFNRDRKRANAGYVARDEKHSADWRGCPLLQGQLSDAVKMGY